jgi:hypothetical protein
VDLNQDGICAVSIWALLPLETRKVDRLAEELFVFAPKELIRERQPIQLSRMSLGRLVKGPDPTSK